MKKIKLDALLIEYFSRWYNEDSSLIVHFEMIAHATETVFHIYETREMEKIDENRKDLSWMVNGFPGKGYILIPCFIMFSQLLSQYFVWSKKRKIEIPIKEVKKEELRLIDELINNPDMTFEMKESFLHSWNEITKEMAGWAVKMH